MKNNVFNFIRDMTVISGFHILIFTQKKFLTFITLSPVSLKSLKIKYDGR